MGDKLDNLTDIAMPLAGAAITAGAAFTAASLVWSLLYLGHKWDETVAFNARNQDAFNMVAGAQDPDVPSDQWLERQEDITGAIRSEGKFMQWLIFDGLAEEGDRAVNAADRAEIYMVPNDKPGQSLTLTVNQHFGCLQVPYDKPDGAIADQAREVLRVFDSRAKGAYQSYGQYRFQSEKDAKASVRFEPRSTGAHAQAEEVCPVVSNAAAYETWRKSEPPRFVPRLK